METTFDAIVIGSGISGGWAAKEFCEKGLKTLVLERGRDIKHIKDYPTATMAPWDFKHRGWVDKAYMDKNPLISKAAALETIPGIFLFRMQIIPIFRKSPLIGSGDTRWAANH